MSEGLWIALAVVAVLVVTALVVGFVRYRRSRISLAAPEETAKLVANEIRKQVPELAKLLKP